MHLWSVELFMAFLVIHLWGKFWMAAWRGRRALTWITGVVAFVAAIMECFTGYLSQQNLDSQWIATNGKDAFNATGIGAFSGDHVFTANSSATGRYVLIWITSLPPMQGNSSQYQALIYNIVVRGTPATVRLRRPRVRPTGTRSP